MSSLSRADLLSGGPAYLPEATHLQAGPLSMVLEQGELRAVRLGDLEIIRRIYVTLRGPDWRTFAARLSDLRVQADADAFQVAYRLDHGPAGVAFAWDITLTGNREALSFSARGTATAGFLTNRVGLCLLHPAGVAGHAARPGSGEERRFPELIDPHAPFPEFTRFSHQAAPGLWAELAYAGEIFEMEDQRNWTDGSFKSYCPPQRMTKPMQVEAGFTLTHGVTLRLQGAVPAAPPAGGRGGGSRAGAAPAELRLAPESAPLPAWGLGQASHDCGLGAGDRSRLRALAPAHVRCDFRLAHPGSREALAGAAETARHLDAPVEAALLLSGSADQAGDELADFATAWKAEGARVARWLVFQEGRDGTPAETLDLARRHLAGLSPGAAFAIGSKGDFVLLNRNRPAPETLAASPDLGLAFAVTPQVHAFDNRNLVDSLDGQAWVMKTARSLWPALPLAVTPVTLKRSPFAAGLKSPQPAPAGAYRTQADDRQMSLFGAAWTLAALRALLVNGAASLTCFETTGLLGILAGENTGPEDRIFPESGIRMEPGWAYPLYHVFADLAEFKGGELLDLAASRPGCAGLGLRAGNRQAVLLANLGAHALRVNADLGRPAGMRRLHEHNAEAAMADAEAFRRLREPFTGGEIELLPFELIRLDY